MDAPIRLAGLADNWKDPGAWAEIKFAQGPANAALGARTALVIGPKRSTGTATVNTIYELSSEGAAALLAGSGSPSHRVTMQYMKYGSAPALYGVFYTPTGGTQAKYSVSVSTGGTSPTKRGTATIQALDKVCSYGFTVNDNSSSIADGLAAATNVNTMLPITATAYSKATGTGVTFTDKIATAAGNVAYRIRTEVTSGCGVTLGAGSDIYGGVGDDSTPLTNALAVVANVRRYYVGVPVSDATLAALLKTHINNKSQPNPGLRSVGIVGGRLSLADTTTIANGLNHERIQYVMHEDSDHDPAQLVGEIMGLRAQEENTDTAVNLTGRALNLNKQHDEDDWATPDERSTAINEGIAMIGSNDSTAYLVMNVDTRSKNSSGTVNDFRVTEAHRVSVADEFVDRCLLTWNQNFAGKKFKDDDRLADGTVNPNQIYTRNTVKPSQLRKMVAVILQQFEDEEKMQNTAASIASLRSQKSTLNASRGEAAVNIHAIDHHNQLFLQANEVSEA
jgi:phage tail sheath gpL-like